MATSLAPSYVPVPMDDLIVEQHGTLCVLVHPEHPFWTVTTSTGAEIARLCDGRRSLREIARVVAARYGRALPEALSDVMAYMDQLQESGLLAVRGGESSEVCRIERLHINVTDRCTLRCIHCAVSGGRPGADALATEQILRLMDELAENGGGAVALSGGEPLLREDCLDLIEYGVERLSVSLATNGTLLDEETARRLADLPVNVQVSLDAASALRHDAVRGDGAFERTWRGIDRLVRFGAGERTALCATLMRPMLDDVPGILDLALEHGVSSVRFIPIQKMGRAVASWPELGPSPEEYARIYRYLYCDLPERFQGLHIQPGLHGFQLRISEGERWCRVGRFLAADSDGSLYPCPLMMGTSFRIGHVTEMSLEEAARSPELMGAAETCAARWRGIAACGACTWRTLCQAGCPGNILLQKGTLWDTDDLCGLRKELYGQAIFGVAEAKIAEADRGGY